MNMISKQLTKHPTDPVIRLKNICSLREYLLENKTYWDMTANHVNHPNDYTVRMYAQVILARMGIGSAK